MNNKPISMFTGTDETAVENDIRGIITDFLTINNERINAQMRYDSIRTQRPAIWDCGISDLPPTVVKGGPLSMLKWVCDAFDIVTPDEFKKLTFTEIMDRMKTRINETAAIRDELGMRFAELKTGQADIAADVKRAAAAAEDNGKNIDTLQTTMNDGFDDVCKVVGEKFGDKAPPNLKDIKDESELDKLFKVCKIQTKKHERDRSCTLEALMENNTSWTFKGWTIKEVCHGDVQELRDFMNRQRQKNRGPK